MTASLDVRVHLNVGDHAPASRPREMGGAIQHVIGEAHSGAICSLVARQDTRYPWHTSDGRRFEIDAFFIVEQSEERVHFFVADCEEAVDETLHRLADEAGWTPDRETVGRRDVVDPEVLHRDLVMKASVDAEEHARRMGRLGEDAVYVIAEG